MVLGVGWPQCWPRGETGAPGLDPSSMERGWPMSQGAGSKWLLGECCVPGRGAALVSERPQRAVRAAGSPRGPALCFPQPKFPRLWRFLFENVGGGPGGGGLPGADSLTGEQTSAGKRVQWGRHTCCPLRSQAFVWGLIPGSRGGARRDSRQVWCGQLPLSPTGTPLRPKCP